MRKTVDIELLNSGYRYAWSLCSNQQDAEDLVHDAWIRVSRRYGHDPEKRLFFRIIRNLYIDLYRRRRLGSERLPMIDTDVDAGLAHDPGSHYAEAQSMQIRLDQLRDVEREAIYLSVVEGYTADEIATMTNSVRGTVLSLVHRAKQKLRKLEDADSTGTEPSNIVPLKRDKRTR